MLRHQAFFGRYAIDAFVSLLLHMDGSNASTTFTDSSLTPKTVTPSGNAQISTAQSKFGGASALFDGTTDYISAGPDTSLDPASGDFTLEGWLRPSTQVQTIGGIFGFGAFTMMLYIQGTNAVLEMSSNGSSNQIAATAFAVTLNTWQHFAIVRQGTSIKVYKDGVQTYSGTFTGALNTSGKTLRIGWNGSTSAETYTGYVDEVRLSKGVARYTAGFTPASGPF
jgi:hypothetical protein